MNIEKLLASIESALAEQTELAASGQEAQASQAAEQDKHVRELVTAIRLLATKHSAINLPAMQPQISLPEMAPVIQVQHPEPWKVVKVTAHRDRQGEVTSYTLERLK